MLTCREGATATPTTCCSTLKQHRPFRVYAQALSAKHCIKKVHRNEDVTLTCLLPASSTFALFQARVTTRATRHVVCLNDQNKSEVVVVGGGPAGLATVLMLSHRGWSNITLLERNNAVDFVDPNRAYVYSIDSRGRKFTDKYNLSSEVAEAGVSTLSVGATLVPFKGKAVARQTVMTDGTRVSHWLPRAALMQVLLKAVQVRVVDNGVKILTNTKVVSMNRDTEQASITLVAEDQSGVQVNLSAKLVVGCDGLQSIVRRSVAGWQQADNTAQVKGTKDDDRSFDMESYPSLSTGLKFKVLQLQPNPVTREGIVMENPGFGVLTGAPLPEFAGTNPLRLGLLPIKDPTAPRTGNVITFPDHPFWEVKDYASMRRVLDASFPQVDFDVISTHADIERFATCSPGSFPAPQYSMGMTYVLAGQGECGDGAAGVVLLGDALHCFPPDMGQGVNSAFEDVVVFEQVLEEAGDDLKVALPVLEERRMPDVRGLIKVSQIAFALQYNQYPLRRTIFNLCYLAHTMLSQAVPFVPPPAFMMVQNAKMSYAEVWEKVKQTPLRIGMLVAALVVAVKAVCMGVVWMFKYF